MGQCPTCIYKFRAKLGCEAFPDDIPIEIALGEFDHTAPHPSQKDKSILFTEYEAKTTMKSPSVLELIERNQKLLTIDLCDDSWRLAVPSSPGWYFFETNTPPNVFNEIGSPIGERHYNIPQKAKDSFKLTEFGAIILPEDSDFYFVYSGEAKNLKARAREHLAGHSKTGCLALANYPILFDFGWKFHFSVCDFGDAPNDSKLLRIYGEQLWRAKYGWPILCAK